MVTTKTESTDIWKLFFFTHINWEEDSEVGFYHSNFLLYILFLRERILDKANFPGIAQNLKAHLIFEFMGWCLKQAEKTCVEEVRKIKLLLKNAKGELFGSSINLKG